MPLIASLATFSHPWPHASVDETGSTRSGEIGLRHVIRHICSRLCSVQVQRLAEGLILALPRQNQPMHPFCVGWNPSHHHAQAPGCRELCRLRGWLETMCLPWKVAPNDYEPLDVDSEAVLPQRR
jgi:hypothetical protein